MDNKKGKYLITLFILIIIIIILGSISICLIYNNTKGNEKESDSTQYNYNLSKRKSIQLIREEYIQILVDTQGNAYLLTTDSIDNIKNTTILKNLKTIEKSFSNYSPVNYENYGNTSITAIKLNIENVLNVYDVVFGNGGFKYFIFVKENGEISYLCYDNIIYNGQINIKDVTNLKNVISIVENEYTLTPYAITLDGKEVSLYDYLQQ